MHYLSDAEKAELQISSRITEERRRFKEAIDAHRMTAMLLAWFAAGLLVYATAPDASPSAVGLARWTVVFLLFAIAMSRQSDAHFKDTWHATVPLVGAIANFPWTPHITGYWVWFYLALAALVALEGWEAASNHQIMTDPLTY